MKSIPTTLLAILTWITSATLACADGLIIVHPPSTRPDLMPIVPPGHFSFAPLEVLYHHVNVEIDHLTATTSIDQAFRNPNNTRLEGTYVFPLPPGAHIDQFSMDIDGTMTDAELLPADKAKSLYENIVRQMKDPALLEYVGRDAFKVRIFPIEPNSVKKIKIRYTQLLKDDGGHVEYIYPLNTEKFSATPLKEVSVKVSIRGKSPLKSIYCPSHTAEIKRHDDQSAVVGYEARDVRPDADFKVVFSRSPNPLAMDLICSRPSNTKDGYFLLLASPGMTAPTTVQPKDICFVIDTSGSMTGAKLNQAKNALRFCLANLNADDHFEIVRFATESDAIFNQLVPATKENINQALTAIDGFKPIGGTAIGEALEKALSLRKETSIRPYQVVFLTDGIPTIGETREEPLVNQVLKSNTSSTRVFAFGIGNDVNTHLLDRIATETRAVSGYVADTEDIEVKLSNFYAKIKDPVFCDLKLSFSNPDIHISQLQPNRLPDLFNGDMLVLFGRYTGHGESNVIISGLFNGTPREFTSHLTFAEIAPNNSYVAPLWATRRVGWLLDEIRLHGESSELKEEVTTLARTFGIVTPYTAYLILEDEKKRDVPVAMRNMQELEQDEKIYQQAEIRMKSLHAEAASEAARSGRSAVANSTSMAHLKDQSAADAFAPAVRMELDKAPHTMGGGYRAEQSRNYATQTRNLNGRAFYQNGKIWMDSTAQAKHNLQHVKIHFNSDAYFALLNNHPDTAQWLSLGNNVDLVIDDTIYQIRDDNA